jgi:hypothetical protein
MECPNFYLVDSKHPETTIHKHQEEIMKYMCLGYMEEQKWDDMPENERNAWMEECCAYDAVLRKNGHFIGGEALESVRLSTTLKYRDGKVSITDGPYAETKEQLGGVLILEAADLNEAIQLISKHPGLRAGSFEIRPIANILPEDTPRISDPK